MVEIEAPIYGINLEIIEKVAVCVPNLRELRVGIDSSSIVKEILQHCTSLQKLEIYHIRIFNLCSQYDTVGGFEEQIPLFVEISDILGEIFKHINDYGHNLKEVLLYVSDDFMFAGEIREKLKDRKGLKISWTNGTPIII